jgi:hypothetical protein
VDPDTLEVGSITEISKKNNKTVVRHMISTTAPEINKAIKGPLTLRSILGTVPLFWFLVRYQLFWFLVRYLVRYQVVRVPILSVPYQKLSVGQTGLKKQS